MSTLPQKSKKKIAECLKETINVEGQSFKETRSD